MTHSYQEFESRDPTERGLGRAAMRDCPIAGSELTPVNRSRSGACAARIVAASACVGGIQVTLRAHRSSPLTSVHTEPAATENRRSSRCRGPCSAGPPLVEFLSRKAECFRGATSRSSAIRENFGDLPATVSHGGRRSLLNPGLRVRPGGARTAVQNPILLWNTASSSVACPAGNRARSGRGLDGPVRSALTDWLPGGFSPRIEHPRNGDAAATADAAAAGHVPMRHRAPRRYDTMRIRAQVSSTGRKADVMRSRDCPIGCLNWTSSQPAGAASPVLTVDTVRRSTAIDGGAAEPRS
jgi:hypothetical protein